jgi:branched-chain amino acid transport system ATP-binding protein
MSAPELLTAARASAPAGGPGTDSDLLALRAVEVSYGGASLALRGVTLRVGQGQAVAVLGSNGAGKTTTIRAVSSLLGVHGGRIVAGEVVFAGVDVRRMRPHQLVARGLAQVPEGRMVFKHLTVEENLRVGASARKDSGAAAALEQVYELFPRLRERRSQKAGWMSGGEQQMVAIGRALMAAPRLLLLDEVSLGLAPLIVESIFEQLAKARAELDLAVLLVEQNARVALDFADYGYIMENGRIALEGSSDELRHNPEVQASYLGSGATRERFGARRAARPRRRWLS